MGKARCGGGKVIFLVALERWHVFLGTMLIHRDIYQWN